MDIATTRHNILTDEAFVLAEVAKMQYCFGLKQEIRYGLERGPDDWSESVAEHIYGMSILVDYFLKLEELETKLDQNIVRATIAWHDMDELETGDTISWKKSDAQIASEETAWQAVVPHLPTVIADSVTSLVNDYEHLTTPEAQFVKAIDKTEPLFHMLTEPGRDWSAASGMTRNDSERTKYPYLADFPIIKRFHDVVHDEMERRGFFAS